MSKSPSVTAKSPAQSKEFTVTPVDRKGKADKEKTLTVSKIRSVVARQNRAEGQEGKFVDGAEITMSDGTTVLVSETAEELRSNYGRIAEHAFVSQGGDESPVEGTSPSEPKGDELPA